MGIGTLFSAALQLKSGLICLIIGVPKPHEIAHPGRTSTLNE
jgi:hypothetical protein